jgi:DNA-directed RNA polymerase sigma subunit (sigma70/sigma32)
MATSRARVSTTARRTPREQRQVIALRYGVTGEERTSDQTAADLDISPQQVRALERAALQRLRELSSLADLELAA